MFAHYAETITICPFFVVKSNQHTYILIKNLRAQDFPGGPVVKHLPSNAGDAGSIPGQRTKIPHAEEQLSPRHNKEPMCCN